MIKISREAILGDSHVDWVTSTASAPCCPSRSNRRLEAHKAAQVAMAEIVEAQHRGHGILSISEMSRLSGLSHQEISVLPHWSGSNAVKIADTTA